MKRSIAWRRWSLLAALWLGAHRCLGQDTERHPLDPLAAEEITKSVELLKASERLPEAAVFPSLTLQEPTKAELAAFAAGEPVPRRAAALAMSVETHRTYEAVIDLTAGRIESWKELQGVQPMTLLEEYDVANEIVRADPRWQAAMRKRGITDFDAVHLDGWAPGHVPNAEGVSRRMMRVIAFLRGDGVNSYGRPIEGVVALVDMRDEKVVHVLDSGFVPISDGEGTDFYEPEEVGEPRSELKPLLVTQPEGPAFELDGHKVRWQNWRFRYSLHPREGLVLHTVGYEEEGRVRPILHRLSLAEMVVPYADPSEAWNWRSAFDQGEYGLGRTANHLVLGGDVPANAVLLDAVFADDYGKPYVHERAVGLYEQDGGLLWKHFDEPSGRVEVRRARQLVLTYVATIGNYDYAVNYLFQQDGSLEVRIDLTGILLVKGVESQLCERCQEADPTRRPVESQGDQRYGTLVDSNSVAVNHQHIFSFRIDFDIEGAKNSVSESTIRRIPAGPDNPFANAFVHVETPLLTEKEARRDLDLAEHRRWKIYNQASRNELGHFAAYMLEPGDNSVAYLGSESPVRKRAGYIQHHVWVTRHKSGEEHAAGFYPRQRAGSDGLPEWSGEESLVDQDVVMWYTLGVTHVPRAEEWPVMSAAHAGFKLVPNGFFTRNPALDLPRP